MTTTRHPHAIKRRAAGRRTLDDVLDCAAASIRVGGVASLRVDAVMKGAGKTVGGFYSLFGSRDDLASAAVGRLLGLPLRLLDRCAQDLDPKAGVVAYVTYYLSAPHRDLVTGGCPMPALLGELARMDLAIRSQADTALGQLASAIEAKLNASGVTPRTPVVTAISEMIGTLAVARAIHDLDRANQLLAAARISVFAKLGLDAGVVGHDALVDAVP